MVTQSAKNNGVSPETAIAVINCEDTTWQVDKQSDYYKNGKREESYGLAQINLPSHPNISYNEAINPSFAIDYLTSELAAGHGNMWTCYRKLNR